MSRSVISNASSSLAVTVRSRVCSTEGCQFEVIGRAGNTRSCTCSVGLVPSGLVWLGSQVRNCSGRGA